MEWRYLDEYEKLVIRMNTPRVVIDNAVCPTATLVQVDSARNRGVLLEAVQVLTDLNLSIKKAYISSDGRWFMDVFHVTDADGRKLTDESVISYIEQSLGTWNEPEASTDLEGLTALEITGNDRPGLLSEVFAVLADLQCSVVEAKVWSHNGRIACLVFVKDERSGSPIDDDHNKMRGVEARLGHLLRGNQIDMVGTIAAVPPSGVVHADRRLHQMMFAECDSEKPSVSPRSTEVPTTVSVQNWADRGYSIVTVQCRDRPKLLFDVVCTLTDMEYVVFHGTIDTQGEEAHQEFFIRHADGTPITAESEQQQVIKCLQAAICRRASEGLRLELCTVDRPGLLSQVTRTFRENGLLVTSAEVATKGDKVMNVFYVTDTAGQPADPKAIDAIRHAIGSDCLSIKEEPRSLCRKASRDGRREANNSAAGTGLFYLGSLVKRNLLNFGLIGS